MNVFVDTSALFALIDGDDVNHAISHKTWGRLLADESSLVTTNYVLLEVYALLQRRIGMDAIRDLNHDFAPALEVLWVSAETHRFALAAVLAANRRDLSVVDCVSFQIMRDNGVRAAFCFDTHFSEQGFEILA